MSSQLQDYFEEAVETVARVLARHYADEYDYSVQRRILGVIWVEVSNHRERNGMNAFERALASMHAFVAAYERRRIKPEVVAEV